MSITKALTKRENKIKNGPWPDWEICFGWENDVIQHLRGQVKPLYDISQWESAKKSKMGGI